MEAILVNNTFLGGTARSTRATLVMASAGDGPRRRHLPPVHTGGRSQNSGSRQTEEKTGTGKRKIRSSDPLEEDNGTPAKTPIHRHTRSAPGDRGAGGEFPPPNARKWKKMAGAQGAPPIRLKAKKYRRAIEGKPAPSRSGTLQ